MGLYDLNPFQRPPPVRPRTVAGYPGYYIKTLDRPAPPRLKQEEGNPRTFTITAGGGLTGSADPNQFLVVYQVPINRVTRIDSLSSYLTRIIAAGTPGVARIIVQNTVLPYPNTNVFTPALLDLRQVGPSQNNVGDSDRITIASLGTMQSRSFLNIFSTDTSVGGTFQFFTSLRVTEIDE